jgi:hypothetical protein
MQIHPSAFDREVKAGFIFRGCRLVLVRHRRVDLLDGDASVLDGLEGVSKLEELTRSAFGITEDAAPACPQ